MRAYESARVNLSHMCTFAYLWTDSLQFAENTMGHPKLHGQHTFHVQAMCARARGNHVHMCTLGYL
jgi:hypothetical protein